MDGYAVVVYNAERCIMVQRKIFRFFYKIVGSGLLTKENYVV